MRSSFTVGFAGGGLLPTRGSTGSWNLTRDAGPMGQMVQSLQDLPSVQDQFGPQPPLFPPISPISPAVPQIPQIQDWIIDDFGPIIDPSIPFPVPVHPEEPPQVEYDETIIFPPVFNQPTRPQASPPLVPKFDGVEGNSAWPVVLVALGIGFLGYTLLS